MYAPHHNPEMHDPREFGPRGRRRGRGRRSHFDRPGFDRSHFDRPDFGRSDPRAVDVPLRHTVGLLHGAAFAVASGGNDTQIAEAETILADARRALFALLAEKEEPADGSAAEENSPVRQ